MQEIIQVIYLVSMKINNITWKITRIAMAFVFLWAFFDKLFGLGYSTSKAASWLAGGSPTQGFLLNGTTGVLFGKYFSMLAGIGLVDWLFMLGLLFVGVTLLFNRCIRWGAFAGMLMMFLMWLALVPSKSNPIVDSHVIYMLVLALFATKGLQKEK